MKKDVIITIRSNQSVPGSEDEKLELVTLGTYHFGKDEACISYQESAITGLDGTSTMFRIRPDEVVLSRKGSVNSKMVFRPGEWGSFFLSSDIGMLKMGLDTRHMECSMGEHGGSMEIEYDLDFERLFVSRNTFQIEVTEKGMRA
ncbi:MAG: DUF1934 domain-containing protein [Oscillospiraceae bacterium]|nr:DUF1934 domain-containing protein [Oscillospiraceae bacterium]